MSYKNTLQKALTNPSSDSMQDIWEKLHAQPRFRPKYPNEFVVRWALTQFQPASKPKILDLGCGGGRHSIFLAQEGFDVYASDISREGIDATKSWAETLKLQIHTKASPAHLIEYPEHFFDGVLCFAVLYYSKKTEMEAAIQKIYNALKPKGKLFFVTRGDQDWRTQYAEKIAPCEYLLSKLGSGTPADSEKGMTQTFLNLDEVKDLMKNFEHVSIDSCQLSWSNGQYIDHDWLISATKC